MARRRPNPMLAYLRRVARQAAKGSTAATAQAARKAVAGLLGPGAAPPKPAARKPRPAAAKPAAAKPAPRASLKGTLRRLEAEAPVAPGTRAPAMPRGAAFLGAVYADDRGERAYKLYLPSGFGVRAAARRRLPLVVMLHGCGQTPDDFAAGTRMNALAEEFGLIVAYPEQPVSANRNRCWNWFDPRDQTRGAGEPALIAGIARAVLASHHADPERVYVAGLSAGGSAAAILGAAYRDVFAAVGIHSGLPAGAAHSTASALLAMRRGAPGRRPDFAMPTIVFHGDADSVVHPGNGRYVAARALVPYARLARSETSRRAAGGRGYTRTVHRLASGKPVCEHWVVKGAGHAWSGGDAAGSFTDPAGPDAARAMLRFFLRHRRAREPAP